MKFSEVVAVFDKIEKASKRLEMTDFLVELLRKAGKNDVQKIVYLSQARLAPEYKDLEVGMGEQFVMESIAKISGYKKEQVQKAFKEKGDLGLVAQELMEKKKQSSLFKEELTVDKVFNNFLKIAETSGAGSQQSKIKLLAELLNSATPLEAKYITRVPLGELRSGTGDPTIMDALALCYLEVFRKNENKLEEELKEKYKKEEDLKRQMKMKLREQIESKYNVYPDLGAIAALLKDKGLHGLMQLDIEVGVPIRPTLAERLNSAEEIIEKLGECVVEAKYDGLRLQVHKKGNNVTIYSRRLEQMTHMFPDIVKSVREQIKAKEAIVEGEALAVNEKTGEFHAFQITIQRKRKHDVKEFAKKYPLKLFLFDCMYLDGENLMPLPFKERQSKLKASLKNGAGMEITERIITKDAKELETFFEESLNKGLEGIIAKDMNAKYTAGARKFAWIKLKRSYSGALHDTVDVAIIGYFKGKGQRTVFGMGALLVAAYNKQKDRFESIAKVGTGLSEEQLKDFAEKLGKIEKAKKPARVESELKPDHWVELKYVIEVNADEITKSPLHKAAHDEMGTGLALRFPRLVQLRIDKKPEDCTDVEEIVEMYKKQATAS